MSILFRLFGRKASAPPRLIDAREYAQEFAAYVRSEDCRSTVVVAQDPRTDHPMVTWEAPDGTRIHQCFVNWYARYRANPENKQHLFRDQWREVVARLEGLSAPQSANHTRVLPLLKTTDWYHGALQQLRSVGEQEPQKEFIVEDVAPGLIVVYVQDTPQSMTFLSAEAVASMQLSLPALREQAFANLRHMLPALEVKGSGGVFLARIDSNFDATMALLLDEWEHRFEVAGQPVVAVPARDQLLVCGSDDAEALAMLHNVAKDISSTSPYALSDRLFLRCDGKFEAFMGG